MFTRFGWHSQVLDSPIVKRMLDGIKLTVRQTPCSKNGVFFIPHKTNSSVVCKLPRSCYI